MCCDPIVTCKLPRPSFYGAEFSWPVEAGGCGVVLPVPPHLDYDPRGNINLVMRSPPWKGAAAAARSFATFCNEGD